MPATLADYLAFDDTDIALATQWPVMSRCLQALTPYFQAKIATGTEPSDVLSGMYLGVDGQSTTTKDWRFLVSSTNGFFIQENTGSDASPVWVDRLSLPLGGGLVSPHASSHQHGGTDEVATATPGANAIPKANGSGQLAAGWLTGVITNAEIAALAGIVYSKLNLSASIVNADVAAAAAIELTKLAALTASRVPVLNSSGFLTASTITATELLFLATGNLRELIFSDDGAGGGPTLRLTRVSASPAAADGLALIDWSGRNSAAGTLVYNRLAGAIVDPTSTSEDSYLSAQVRVAGTLTETARINDLGILFPIQTASRAAAFDANKNIVSATTTLAELNFLSGVTSGVQAQINALSAGSDFVHLATYTPSAAASVDITSIISATYDQYLFIFNLQPATDAVTLNLRTDTSNGASFDSGGSDYGYRTATQNGASALTGNGNAAVAQIVVSPQVSIGNQTGEGIAGQIWLHFVGSASFYPRFTWAAGYGDTGTLPVHVTGMGQRASAAAINAVQLFFSSGNIASGTVRVYGLVNS